MTGQEAIKILDAALDRIGEHFDAIQIHATWMPDGGSTKSIHRGSGNFYARESLSREFVERNRAQEQADFIGEKLDPPDDDWKKAPP